MCSIKRFLISCCVALGAISIFEILYTILTLFKYCQQFSTYALVTTGIINVGIVFFGVNLMIGALNSNIALLLVCLVYFIIESIRSGFSLFVTWTETHNDLIEKTFVTFDAGKKLL